MEQKKTALRAKTWRLGGETLTPAPLSDAEERRLSDTFSDFQALSKLEPALGVSAATMRSRETTARACLGYFCERFESAYGREAVGQALTTALALPLRVGGYAPERSIPLGAALWTLDYVEKRNLQSDLLPLLPESCPDTELLFLGAEDVRYPPDMLPRLTYVFINRKSASIKEFRKLMGLIRKEDAAQLRQAFQETLLDYFARFLEVCKRVAPSPTLFPTPEPAHSLSPLPAAKDLFSTSAGKKQPPPPNLKEIPERTPDMAFLIKTPSLIGLPPEKMRSELYYRRMSELLSEFAVKNPYEICAASVLLERERDLLMNLNTLTNAVLACAERHLPWIRDYAGNFPPLHGDAPAESALRYLFHKPTNDAPENASDKNAKEASGNAPKEARDDAPDGELLSEEQLFHMATGYLLPRDRGTSEKLAAWFQAQGLPEARAREFSGAAMAFSVFADARTDAESGVWGDAGTNAAGEARNGSRTPDDAERMADLSRQLKSAKQSAHDKEQLIRKLEEDLRDERQRAEQDRMELRALRDTMFRIRAGETPESASAERRVQLPCPIQRRVLIFGGHETWSKSIRPLLPGARFYERESLPDLNAIKGADVVWIQANALSHKFYYRIIETARRENIPVRYFGFASARKCAEQVVENELADASE